MKVGVYLKLKDQNTLFTDPAYVTIEWKGKSKSH